MNRIAGRCAVAALVGLVPVLAACGSDDDTASTSPPTTAASSTTASSGGATTTAAGSSTTVGAPTGKPIVLNLIEVLSTGNQYPEKVAAAKAAAAAINAAGGVAGRPLAITTCDTRQDPAQEATCAQQMVDSDAIAAVAGGAGRSTAVVDTTMKAKIANIGLNGVGATDLLKESTSSFPLYVSLPSTLACPAALAEAGATKIGAITVNLAAADGIVNGAKAVMANLPSKPTFTTQVKVALDATDLAGPVQTALDAGTDGAILGLPRPAALSVLKANNGRLKLCTSDGLATIDDLTGLGDAAAGFISMSSVPTVSLLPKTGDGAQYVADLDAYFKASGDKDAAPAQRKGTSVSAWMAVYAFARVADKIDGEITRESVFDAFTKTTDLQFPGLLSKPVDFTKFQVVPNLARLFVSEYTGYTWNPATKSYVAGKAPADLIKLLTGAA